MQEFNSFLKICSGSPIAKSILNYYKRTNVIDYSFCHEYVFHQLKPRLPLLLLELTR